jgi:hypothetical protein
LLRARLFLFHRSVPDERWAACCALVALDLVRPDFLATDFFEVVADLPNSPAMDPPMLVAPPITPCKKAALFITGLFADQSRCSGGYLPQRFDAKPFQRLQQPIKIRPNLIGIGSAAYFCRQLLVLPVSLLDWRGGSWDPYGGLRDS